MALQAISFLAEPAYFVNRREKACSLTKKLIYSTIAFSQEDAAMRSDRLESKKILWLLLAAALLLLAAVLPAAVPSEKRPEILRLEIAVHD